MNCNNRENCKKCHMGHWPTDFKKEDFKHTYYNVIVYEMVDDTGDHYYVPMSADILGVSCRGNTIEEVLHEFKKFVKCIIDEVGTGVYPDTSNFEFQNEDAKELEKMWREDGIEIINKSFHVVYIFDDNDEDENEEAQAGN